MKCFKKLKNISQPSAVALGNFDGVHNGHQALLKHLLAEAKRRRLEPVVVVFEPQPSEYFSAHKSANKAIQLSPRLYTLRQKYHYIQELGEFSFYCISFNEKIASLEPEVFARQFIFESLQAKYVLVGNDFRFGVHRSGDVALLQRMALEQHAEVHTFAECNIDKKRVSSTAIRECLQRGDLDYATKLLGRPFGFIGRVGRGRGLAREWAVPTANIVLLRKVLPIQGVFLVRVRHCKTQEWFWGVANIGCRPTLTVSKPLLEVHLFDVERQLYGEFLEVFLCEKIRDEQRFGSIDQLVQQIHKDISVAHAKISDSLLSL
ncbi:MAG: bifunctional riboflavin kinase/FAD synthetase [Legionellaceae bacterium]|nr:bifunctional riboflavin kinase/FAD synthetase [Legionellaceae bacterium]